jgi:hypothetical protein
VSPHPIVQRREFPAFRGAREIGCLGIFCKALVLRNFLILNDIRLGSLRVQFRWPRGPCFADSKGRSDLAVFSGAGLALYVIDSIRRRVSGSWMFNSRFFNISWK